MSSRTVKKPSDVIKAKQDYLDKLLNKKPHNLQQSDGISNETNLFTPLLNADNYKKQSQKFELRKKKQM